MMAPIKNNKSPLALVNAGVKQLLKFSSSGPGAMTPKKIDTWLEKKRWNLVTNDSSPMIHDILDNGPAALQNINRKSASHGMFEQSYAVSDERLEKVMYRLSGEDSMGPSLAMNRRYFMRKIARIDSAAKQRAAGMPLAEAKAKGYNISQPDFRWTVRQDLLLGGLMTLQKNRDRKPTQPANVAILPTLAQKRQAQRSLLYSTVAHAYVQRATPSNYQARVSFQHSKEKQLRSSMMLGRIGNRLKYGTVQGLRYALYAPAAIGALVTGVALGVVFLLPNVLNSTIKGVYNFVTAPAKKRKYKALNAVLEQQVQQLQAEKDALAAGRVI